MHFNQTIATSIVALTFTVLTGCNHSEADSPTTAQTASAPPKVTMVSVEEAIAAAALQEVSYDDNTLALATNKIKKGDVLTEVLNQMGAKLGAPQHHDATTINWLHRTTKGMCANLMVTVDEGRINRAVYTDFPKGSMGEAKCQNWL